MPPADLAGVALGKQRLGVNLLSLMAAWREEGRLPFRTIQWFLRTVHQLRLSLGAIVGAVHQVARRGQPELARIVDRIRASPVVHADETGWRQDGANGCVRTFATPTQRYFLRRGRNKEVVDEALGDGFAGVLVSDFYAAYYHYDGPKRRCRVHLLMFILRWPREARVPAATGSALRGCVQPAGGSPPKSTGPFTAGTWTAASPATICPTLRRILPWRPWHTWVAPGGA